MLSPSPVNLAVLASGNGSNFEALVHAERHRGIGGHITVLLCDQPGAPVLDRARHLGIEALTPPTGTPRTRLADERPWLEALRARQIGVVLLAGFMRRLHAPLLDAFPDRILNVHPSLLPEFPGLDAIGQAFRGRVHVTGVTVHLVSAELDAGAILAQTRVEVRDDDTLESLGCRVHAAEHALYPETVRRFLTEPLRGDGGRVRFERTSGASRG